MKSILTLIIGTIAISFASLAAPDNNSIDNTTSEYFICKFENAVTDFELNELKQQGFEVVDSESNENIVYVTAAPQAQFSTEIKSKMKELIMVDRNGNRTYIKETVTEDSPEFLKLFFNFI